MTILLKLFEQNQCSFISFTVLCQIFDMCCTLICTDISDILMINSRKKIPIFEHLSFSLLFNQKLTLDTQK